MNNGAPKVFISHASEDKEHFVRGFAERLRGKGVDAWFDQWEIKPGDSLIQRIFEDGIKNAEGFIIVLSSRSVQKPWVREELDSGMVQRIQKAVRVIPVVIDECEVPNTLRHLKWVKIKDSGNYDPEFSEIVSTIFGSNDRPPLGQPPAHVRVSETLQLPNLTKVDSLILAVFCRHYLKTSNHYIGINEVDPELGALGLSDPEICECLESLASLGLVRLRNVGTDIYLVELQTTAIDLYLQVSLPDYDNQLLKIVSKIVNDGLDTTESLTQSTGVSTPITFHFLNYLENRSLITIAGVAGLPLRKITSVSPLLRRALRQNR